MVWRLLRKPALVFQKFVFSFGNLFRKRSLSLIDLAVGAFKDQMNCLMKTCLGKLSAPKSLYHIWKPVKGILFCVFLQAGWKLKKIYTFSGLKDTNPIFEFIQLHIRTPKYSHFLIEKFYYFELSSICFRESKFITSIICVCCCAEKVVTLSALSKFFSSRTTISLCSQKILIIEAQTLLCEKLRLSLRLKDAQNDFLRTPFKNCSTRCLFLFKLLLPPDLILIAEIGISKSPSF